MRGEYRNLRWAEGHPVDDGRSGAGESRAIARRPVLWDACSRGPPCRYSRAQQSALASPKPT
jgi:hypothetical protein